MGLLFRETKNVFDQEGKRGVDLFKTSMQYNDRVATGKTRDSIKHKVEQINASTLQLEIRAVGHPEVQRLEDGFSAAQAQQDPPAFTSIAEWVQARGIDPGATEAIWRSISYFGWNTTLWNRTNPNGGTKGVLSTPREQIVNKLLQRTAGAVKSDILSQLRQGSFK